MSQMNEGKADIIIADDHKLFRRGMRALLSEFSFIGEIFEVENGLELLKLLGRNNPLPDIVLLDIQMPVMDGIEANKKIKNLYPDLKVLILTMEDDEQFILHLIREGVDGYLLKNSEPEELETAIKKLLNNNFYITENMTRLLLKGTPYKNFTDPDLPEFSPRELEVLEYICKEYTAPEIAEKLAASTRTIEGYRSRLMEKTGAKNIAGLVVYALKHKLVFV